MFGPKFFILSNISKDLLQNSKSLRKFTVFDTSCMFLFSFFSKHGALGGQSDGAEDLEGRALRTLN